MRAHEKKKLNRLAIKLAVRSGMVNDASGGWRSNTDKSSMDRDLRAGHRTGSSK